MSNSYTPKQKAFFNTHFPKWTMSDWHQFNGMATRPDDYTDDMLRSWLRKIIGSDATADQLAQFKKLLADFRALDAPPPASVSNRHTVISYPFWAWEGTPYHDFAERCVERNHIPRRYFVEGLKTVVGAICGHRIRLENNSMDARFYTVLLSDVGGVGKSTVIDWVIEVLFENTGLLYRNGTATSAIGSFYGGFGSGVGMLKRMCDSPRVLQLYDEVTSMVEKFGIKGSGQNFLGMVNTLYDSNLVPSNDTKDTKMNEKMPEKVWNSILGLSIMEKWDEAFAATSADNSGFFQRLNPVYAEKVKIVGRLHDPKLGDVRAALLKKIQPLEKELLFLSVKPSADQIFESWFTDFREKTKDLPADVTGRVNVLVWRNAMQIAWLLADLSGVPQQMGDFGMMGFEAQITDDVMRRAIALGEYAWRTRLLCRPTVGKNDTARLEMMICERLKKASPLGRRELYRKIGGSRYGLDYFEKAITNLKLEGLVLVTGASAEPGKYRGGRNKETIHWAGQD